MNEKEQEHNMTHNIMRIINVDQDQIREIINNNVRLNGLQEFVMSFHRLPEKEEYIIVNNPNLLQSMQNICLDIDKLKRALIK